MTTSIIVRNLDVPLKTKLRLRAAQHGRSMEEEVRSILRAALSEDPTAQPHLAVAIHQRFAAIGGVEPLDLHREPAREPPNFEA